MRVLLIGKGGREHALAWKLRQTAEHVFVVPGNGGTARIGRNVSNIDAVDMHGFPKLVQLAEDLAVDLVLPGPDDVVVDGIADAFDQGKPEVPQQVSNAAGIPCFAPSRAAAELEGSKTFAKDFMSRHGIPTAESRSFKDYAAAKKYLSTVSHRVVIKVSGLAAGKGVVLPETSQEAQQALRDIMVGQTFGSAGSEVLIEEFLQGDEISILTFSDGRTFKSLPPGQDHKRIFDKSRGPNTGGMGVYGPLSFFSSELSAQVDSEILAPTFEGLRAEGRPFRGMLFTGVMLTEDGPKVLEYNVRFGDPEAQSLVPLMSEDTDLARVCLSCTKGVLEREAVKVRPGYACNVVIASAGYPGEYQLGNEIILSPCPKDVNIFHAGTKVEGHRLITAGGRVFSAAAVRETLQDAVAAAYEGVRSVNFSGMYYRTDIASRDLSSSEEAGE